MNDNLFEKNVILLRFEDYQRDNYGNVLLPTTIDMARIRRSETGQYKRDVQFSRNMSEELVKQRLQEAFPSFNLDEGFFCAAVKQSSNAFEFHGVPRIWDGWTIRRNLGGNSALYIIMDRPAELDQDLLQWIQDNLHYDVNINPAQSPLQDGPPFCIYFEPDLQREVTSGFAIFENSEDVFGTVELERSRLGGYLFGCPIPAAREAGTADVKIESQDRIHLGTARIYYYPDKEQAKMMVERPSLFGRMCENLSQQSIDNSNASASTAQALLPSELADLKETATKEEADASIGADGSAGYMSPDQLSDELVALSPLPKSRWRHLTRLELIKKRNKPREPPWAPKTAPFFLPTTQELVPKLIQTEEDQTDEKDAKSKILDMKQLEHNSEF